MDGFLQALNTVVLSTLLVVPVGVGAQPATTAAEVESQWHKYTTPFIRANLKVGKTTIDGRVSSYPFSN